MSAAHVFGAGSLVSCNVCGIYRMRRSTGFFYAEDVHSNWSAYAPECVPLPVEVPWRHRPVVMFDVETTGLDWAVDRVIEVGIVMGWLEESASGGYEARVQATKQTLINPGSEYRSKVEDTITGLTGIEWSELEAAPSADDACSRLGAFLDEALGDHDPIIAAYNARFDHPFLVSLFQRSAYGIPFVLRNVVDQPDGKFFFDPCVWSRKLAKYAKGGHKLMTVANRLGLIAEGDEARAHRADFDAEVALRVLGRFAGDVPEDLVELYYWQRAADAEWALNFFGTYMPRKHRDERIERLRLSKQESE